MVNLEITTNSVFVGCGSSLISLCVIHERIAPDFKRKDFSVHYCKEISSDIYSMYHYEKIKRIQTISHTKVKTETSLSPQATPP